MKKLLFTDLDGTLLDLETYSCEKVRGSIDLLKKAGISIIFCSSKTWAEQDHYLRELGLMDEPAIVENGSGIFMPDKADIDLVENNYNQIRHHGRQVTVLGKTYDMVLKALERASEKYYPELKYYATQSVEDIAAITGLSIEAAKKATQRDFSETIFNADTNSNAYKSLVKDLDSQGFRCIPGSRYVTVTGSESDKGQAVGRLIEVYKAKYGEVKSYGIGDSMNDLEMLRVVDLPYLVQRPDGYWADVHVNKLSKVGSIGPDGWNVMAKELLAR